VIVFREQYYSLIWHLEDSPRLSRKANEIFACERGEIVLYVPTICLVEIVYLQEKGRISPTLKALLDAELRAGDSGLVLAYLTSRVADAIASVSRTAIPDMPDRIIAATALALGLPLLSRDRALAVVEGLQVIW